MLALPSCTFGGIRCTRRVTDRGRSRRPCSGAVVGLIDAGSKIGVLNWLRRRTAPQKPVYLGLIPANLDEYRAGIGSSGKRKGCLMLQQERGGK